jgi:hypothetical protein
VTDQSTGPSQVDVSIQLACQDDLKPMGDAVDVIMEGMALEMMW